MKKLFLLAAVVSVMTGCVRWKTPTHDVEIVIPIEENQEAE